MKEIIFRGSSHTMGLGLDLELAERYKNDEWLKKNGVILPPQRTSNDWDIINNHRWPKIVCDTLGVNEYDYRYHPKLKYCSLAHFIVELAVIPPESLAERVSHIIYEPQKTRLFYDETQWTPAEMLAIVNDSSVPESEKQFIYDWIDNYDENISIGMKLLKRCMEIHKDIKFIFFMFYGRDEYGVDTDEPHLIEAYNQIEDKIIEFEINGEKSTNLHKLLAQNKLRVCDTAYCYTNRKDKIFGGYKWEIHPFEDIHAGVEAQQMIADNVIRYITGTPTAGTMGTI